MISPARARARRAGGPGPAPGCRLRPWRRLSRGPCRVRGVLADAAAQRLRFDSGAGGRHCASGSLDPGSGNGPAVRGLVSWVFDAGEPLAVAGSPGPGQQCGLNLFLAWWWPLILAQLSLVGRAVGSFCPFMVLGRDLSRLARLFGLQPAAWPRGNTDGLAATGPARLVLRRSCSGRNWPIWSTTAC